MSLKKRYFTVLFSIAISFLIASCSESSTSTAPAADATTNPAVIKLDVYKSATCGCCGSWVKYIDKQGFKADVHIPDNLVKLKLDKGIKPKFQSCHTAVTKEGYIFEGHIPAKYIKKFLKSHPKNAIGLTVPGMVNGTPGMEIMKGKFTPYKIWMMKKDGTVEQYAQLNSYKEQF